MVHEVKSKAAHFIVIFLISTNILDMSGRIGIKYISYILAIIFILINFKKIKFFQEKLVVNLFFFICYPFLAVIIGLINGADLSNIFLLSPFLVLPIAYILMDFVEEGYFWKIYLKTIIFLSLTIIFANIVMLTWPELLNSPNFRKYFDAMDFSQFREFLQMPKAYHRAALFLVPVALYYFIVKEKLLFLLIATALILSVSKGGVIVLVTFLIAYSVLICSFKQKLVILFSSALLLYLGINQFPQIFDNIYESLTLKNETASIRVLHFESITRLFEDHPAWLLFGEGLGTTFYSTALNDLVENIELDHIELVRRYGLVWCTTFYFSIFYIAWSLACKKALELRAIGWGLISAFFAGGTNPVLISPPFLLLFVISVNALSPKKKFI